MTDVNADKLIAALVRETGLSFGLEEIVCPRRRYAVLMACMPNLRANVPLDRLQERLTLKEAVQLLRGILLGFKLGAGHIRPGPQTLRHLRGEPEGVDAPEKD